MVSPLVSVLIPSFNAEGWIEETLRSVLNQTWSNIEIIVVDDGSTDRTVSIAQTYARQGVRLFTQENCGAAAARNRAFQISKGEYIQFLDADDLISPDKIQSQMQLLMVEGSSVATCRWGRFTNEPQLIIIRPMLNWKDLAPIDWLVATWAEGAGMLFPALWLIPRNVVERAGFWREDLSLNDDGEFFTRIVLASDRVLFAANGLAYYRSGNAGTLSSKKSRRAWQSGFDAIEACIFNARSLEDSDRIRRCGSLLWQVYAHGAYPHFPKLANLALKSAALLHRVRLEPQGGILFKLIASFFGWKFARVLQRVAGRQ